MTLRRRLAILLLVAAFAVPAVPAHAEDGVVTVTDIEPGTCTPESVAPFTIVDCRFGLADSGLIVDPFEGAFADLDLPYDEQNGTRTPCHVDGQELVCPSVGTFITPGRRTVSVVIGSDSTPPLAAFDVVERNSLAVQFTATRAEPLVFSGRLLELWVQRSTQERIWALVTTRETGRPVAVFDVGEPDLNDDRYRVDMSSLLPGRYRIAPCIGESAVGCRRVTGGVVAQVGTGNIVPLFAGSARADADRFNIVLAGSGFATVEEVRSTAIELLGLSGPVGLVDGEPASPGVQPFYAVFGPFATEPLASARNLFNLWLLTDLVADPKALFHDHPPRGSGSIGTDGFDLTRVQITTLHSQPPGVLLRSEAGWTSLDGVGPEDIDDIEFAGAYLAVNPSDRWSSASTLTHEWGHALFDLRDEYVEFGRGVTFGYPNCAPDLETARQWWGDLEGSVDPFVEEYAAALAQLGLWFPDWVEADLTTGFDDRSGCYTVDDSVAVRPTADSIMNSGIPICGSVNRRQVEAVLSLVDGRAPIAAGDVALACDRMVVCRGSVRPLVDPPASDLAVSVGGVAAPCSIEEGDSGWGLLACERLVVDPDGGLVVELIAGGSTIASASVPTTTTTTTTTTVTTTTSRPATEITTTSTTSSSTTVQAFPEVPSDPIGTGPLLAVAAGVLLIGVFGVFVLRRR